MKSLVYISCLFGVSLTCGIQTPPQPHPDWLQLVRVNLCFSVSASLLCVLPRAPLCSRSSYVAKRSLLKPSEAADPDEIGAAVNYDQQTCELTPSVKKLFTLFGSLLIINTTTQQGQRSRGLSARCFITRHSIQPSGDCRSTHEKTRPSSRNVLSPSSHDLERSAVMARR